MKRVLCVAAVLFSFAAKAQEADKAGPCVHLRSPGECVGYPTGECFWDVDDFRCESRFDRGETAGGGGCSVLPYAACVSNFACFWDNADNRCERR
jgi:hypothetical protein